MQAQPRDVSDQIAGPDAEVVERLLRDAHIQRLRGEWANAETLCRKALEVAPDDMMGVEMLADILHEKGHTQDALELYRKAFAAQPERGSLEEKIARLVLELAEEQRQRDAALLMLDSPTSQQARKRNATTVILLSLCCPGLGQFFAGDRVRGGILLGVGVVTFFLGFGDLMKFAMQFLVLQEQPVDGVLAAIGMVWLLTYIYSLIDACGRASRADKPLT